MPLVAAQHNCLIQKEEKKSNNRTTFPLKITSTVTSKFLWDLLLFTNREINYRIRLKTKQCTQFRRLLAEFFCSFCRIKQGNKAKLHWQSENYLSEKRQRSTDFY